MKKILHGGTVVSKKGKKKLDIMIKGGKIIGLKRKFESYDNADVIDVTGKLIFPGFIDAHTHFDLEVSNTVTADDFESGTAAAICGGTTTIIDFATQNKGETLSQALNNWHMKAFGKTSCDYAFHMAISDFNDSIRQELNTMFEQGVTSFKVYMTYPAMMLSDKKIYEVLSAVKSFGGVVGVHCENSGIIDGLTQDLVRKGQMGVASHYKSRPNVCEAEAIHRLLTIARLVDVPVVVVHLSTKEGLEEIKSARKQGVKVYVETCPQYLLLDESLYEKDGFEGAKYVCAPPIRSYEDSKALWKALSMGDIQTVATDHCSFTLEQKKMGIDDFRKIPCGLPSVETRGVLMYSYGVAKNLISVEKMCELLCENPARLYGLYPKKGAILVGSDADIVVYDTKNDTTLSSKTHHSKADYSPFENVKTKGRIEKVFLRGEEVVSDSQLVSAYKGKYINRHNGEFFEL